METRELYLGSREKLGVNHKEYMAVYVSDAAGCYSKLVGKVVIAEEAER